MHTQPSDTILEGGQNERGVSFLSEGTLTEDLASPSQDHTADEITPLLASDTQATRPKRRQAAGAHGHGSMNMKAILLHVLGDALGNVGVIATGLVIWLTTWPFKFYFDPIISLVITVIIFSSALPLGKSHPLFT
jgi:Co/Zn/Cd efflux system component